MVIIGIDPHKRTHTASALGPGSHWVLASVKIDASLAGYQRLLRWASAFPERRLRLAYREQPSTPPGEDVAVRDLTTIYDRLLGLNDRAGDDAIWQAG